MKLNAAITFAAYRVVERKVWAEPDGLSAGAAKGIPAIVPPGVFELGITRRLSFTGHGPLAATRLARNALLGSRFGLRDGVDTFATGTFDLVPLKLGRGP